MELADSKDRNVVTGIDQSAGAKRILVFPGGMPRSLEYLERCQRDGQPVIGASSLPYDPSREKYRDWAFLPYVTDPGFDDALVKAIEDLDLGGIFSPNVVVWNYLEGVLKRRAPHVSLVNASPIGAELGGFRTARQHARNLRANPLLLASTVETKQPMSEIELASLFRHADLIPGMCDHDKFCALYEIARHSVSGDIVEIGSWWGKSAFILARLALQFDIGKLLCVDPWSDEHLVQNDEKGLVDVASANLEAEEALRVFEINLLPYSAGHVNYLRLPSVDGAASYRRDTVMVTPAFGRTQYEGRIALLHIDGNHSYQAVKGDILAWCDLVDADGWIIIDDYVWPYGDGPRIAGDEFLAEHADKISLSFVTGSALFIQLSAPIG